MATQVSNGSGKSHGVNHVNGNAIHLDNKANNGRKAANDEALLAAHEIARLVEASREGRLTERANVDQFSGAQRETMQGINDMLDAILLPIGEGNRVSCSDIERQDRRVDHADLQGRPREYEASGQQCGQSPADVSEDVCPAYSCVARGAAF